MLPTPLQAAFQSHPDGVRPPLRVSDYRGAVTAGSFSGPGKEFAPLVTGCGVYDLGFRARISVTGGDRGRWMNGMVTNNIRDLASGHGVYAFLLNPQGRILGDMTVYNQGDALIVETDRSQVEKIVATFDHYIIMDDVSVANLEEKWTALGLSGPQSRQLLNQSGIRTPEMQPLEMITPQCVCDCDCFECTVIRVEDAPQESYEVWLAPKDVFKTWQALVAAGATPVGSEALEMQRIVAGVPLYGVDIRERDLPQETEQMRALNFNKGCYVGQEIVERIRSRGNVHRTFSGFFLEGAPAIAPGEKVFSGKPGEEEKEVGEITSVAVLSTPPDERTLALGYIRREISVPGREVAIGPATGAITKLPFSGAALGQAEDVALHRA